MFGGFLLLGGRASDLLGRQRLFIAGVIVFTAASLVNGVATSANVLIARPGVPGPWRCARLAGRALDRHDDVRRGTGAHQGARRLERDRRRRRCGRPGDRRIPHRDALVALGLLRQPADRRGRRAAVAALRPELARRRASPRPYDAAGAVTVTGGLLVLVFAIVKAQGYGWGSVEDGRAVPRRRRCSLAAFVVIERRSKAPLIRLGIFRMRSLSGSNVAMLLVASGLFAMFYFASLYMQEILGYGRSKPGSRSCRSRSASSSARAPRRR